MADNSKIFKVEYCFKNKPWQTGEEIITEHGEEFFKKNLEEQLFYDYKSDNLDKLITFIMNIPKSHFEKGFPWRNEIIIDGQVVKVWTGKKKTRYGEEFHISFENLKATWGGTNSKSHPVKVKDVMIDRIRRKYEYDNPYRHVISDIEDNSEYFLKEETFDMIEKTEEMEVKDADDYMKSIG